jgi:type IV secretory pathway VirB4 component
MLDLDIEFHGRRGLKQAEQRAQEEQHLEQDRLADPAYQAAVRAREEERARLADFDALPSEEQAELLAGLPVKVEERMALVLGRLGKGVAIGGKMTTMMFCVVEVVSEVDVDRCLV